MWNGSRQRWMFSVTKKTVGWLKATNTRQQMDLRLQAKDWVSITTLWYSPPTLTISVRSHLKIRQMELRRSDSFAKTALLPTTCCSKPEVTPSLLRTFKSTSLWHVHQKSATWWWSSIHERICWRSLSTCSIWTRTSFLATWRTPTDQRWLHFAKSPSSCSRCWIQKVL